MYLHRVSFFGLSLLSFTLLRPQQQRRRNKHFCAHFFLSSPRCCFRNTHNRDVMKKKTWIFGLEQAQSNYCPIIAMPRESRLALCLPCPTESFFFLKFMLLWCLELVIWVGINTKLHSLKPYALTVIAHKTVREFIFIVSFCSDDFPWMSSQINWFCTFLFAQFCVSTSSWARLVVAHFYCIGFRRFSVHLTASRARFCETCEMSRTRWEKKIITTMAIPVSKINFKAISQLISSH